ncbi:hypothetical protein SAMN05216325_11533 [Nitrosomonas marina]|uniref:Uncharacterized protein n=1 Tax=Nitrosomonas marina TaxID=917 RepID=A0A1H8FXJ2_9PROT|nr:hypothetical protein SAMN05216325_11533 [Nitrosomonas marina]
MKTEIKNIVVALCIAAVAGKYLTALTLLSV